MSKAKQEGRIIIRGIDRTDDYRIICQKCHRDFGGTVAAREGRKVHHILCPQCEFGSFENQMRVIRERVNADGN
jgi:hypothetical protein